MQVLFLILVSILLVAFSSACHSAKRAERAVLSPAANNPAPKAGFEYDTVFMEKANGDIEMKIIERKK